MTKAFEKLQAQCRKTLNTRPNGSETLAVQKLAEAIRAYQESGEDKVTPLFTDAVHGELKVNHWGDPMHSLTRKHAANECYQLVSDGSALYVTGAQLLSVAKWAVGWMKGAK